MPTDKKTKKSEITTKKTKSFSKDTKTTFNKKNKKEQRENFIPRVGFSEFQVKLINSILTQVFQEKKSLDKAYALIFAKVKLQALEQGFIIKHVNAMFARLSFYAYVSSLKRPSDFAKHISRLILSYCADIGFPLPDLESSEGFDRRNLKERLEEAREDILMNEGCPIWLEDIGYKELQDKWAKERKALGESAKRYIRTNTLKTTRENLAHLLAEEKVVTKPVKGSNLALQVTSNSALFRTKAFKEGLFEQQDAGSQLIAPFLEVSKGQTVIDTCAGAGGKTLQLAALMENKGSLIALDTEAYKLQDLKKRAKRAGAFNIETRHIDSTKVIKRLYDRADRVLIDAPCSGTGILRRTPDSKWQDHSLELKKLIEIQYDILSKYTRMAKVGGLIVYSTCSILPSENRKQIDRFIEEHKESFEFIEDVSILPSSGFDGFYMAKLKRIA